MDNNNNVPNRDDIEGFTNSEYGRGLLIQFLSTLFQGLHRTPQQHSDGVVPPRNGLVPGGNDVQLQVVQVENAESRNEDGENGINEDDDHNDEVLAVPEDLEFFDAVDEEGNETDSDEDVEVVNNDNVALESIANSKLYNERQYALFLRHLRAYCEFRSETLSELTPPFLAFVNAGLKYCLLYAAMTLRRVSDVPSYRGWANVSYSDEHDYLEVFARGCEKLGLGRLCLGTNLGRILCGNFGDVLPNGSTVSNALKVVCLKIYGSEDSRGYKYLWFVWAPVNSRHNIRGGFVFPSYNGTAYRVGSAFMTNAENYNVENKFKKNLHAQLTKYLWRGFTSTGELHNYERKMHCALAFALYPEVETLRSKRSGKVASSGSKSKRAKKV